MVKSSTISEEQILSGNSPIPSVTFTFELATGNEGIKVIVEPLLKTIEVAEQRARYEFMNNGYSKKPITFKTWRTDININDIISVRGLKFKVTSVNIVTNETKIETTISGVRYE